MKQMRLFYESDDQTLWITFIGGQLYWCFSSAEIIKLEDNSKRRKTFNGWLDSDIYGKKLSNINISGTILQIQRFAGVICSFSDKDLDYLTMKINGEELPSVTQVKTSRTELQKNLKEIITCLHFKEFELLVDMIFREAGWYRISELGGTQPYIDIELYSPVSKETYLVQVKASAGMEEYNTFKSCINPNEKDKHYYFIVNQPNRALGNINKNDPIRCWFAEDIAEYVVTYGLVNWVIGKAK
jgi:hypothetical protein